MAALPDAVAGARILGERFARSRRQQNLDGRMPLMDHSASSPCSSRMQDVSQPAAERVAVGHRTGRLRPDHRGAVRGGDEAGQAYRWFGSGLCGQLGQGADRRAAADMGCR
jgi:hypothetical protein